MERQARCWALRGWCVQQCHLGVAGFEHHVQTVCSNKCSLVCSASLSTPGRVACRQRSAHATVVKTNKITKGAADPA